MRTNEERIAAMHSRAAELKHLKKDRMGHVIRISAAAACFLILIFLSSVMPRFTSSSLSHSAVSGLNASIFSGSSIAGFLVVGIIAFLLGAAFTILCFYLKKWLDEKGPGEEE